MWPNSAQTASAFGSQQSGQRRVRACAPSRSTPSSARPVYRTTPRARSLAASTARMGACSRRTRIRSRKTRERAVSGCRVRFLSHLSLAEAHLRAQVHARHERVRTHGVTTWTLRIQKDNKDDEGCCLGAAITPVTGLRYNDSCYMVIGATTARCTTAATWGPGGAQGQPRRVGALHARPRDG